MSSHACSTAPSRPPSGVNGSLQRIPSTKPEISQELFRLPGQSFAVARELGPRSIDIVPPAEVVQYCRKAAVDEVLSDDELIKRVGMLLGDRQLTTELPNAVLAAKRLDARNGQGRSTRPEPTPPVVRRSDNVCPSCFTIHAGECA